FRPPLRGVRHDFGPLFQAVPRILRSDIGGSHSMNGSVLGPVEYMLGTLRSLDDYGLSCSIDLRDYAMGRRDLLHGEGERGKRHSENCDSDNSHLRLSPA